MTDKIKLYRTTNNIQILDLDETKIRIRPIRETDLDAIHVLFMAANTTAPGSPRLNALKQFLRFKAIGAALSLGGSVYFLGYRWYLSWRFYKYFESKLGADLADIKAYYRLQPAEQRGEHRSGDSNRIEQSAAEVAAEDQALEPTGPSCFWIAETFCPGNTTNNTVIGSIALDFYKQPSPTTAELLRLFVIPSYRKHGLERILVQTLIAHAQANNLESVVLFTWAHQRHVIRLYETFGWVAVFKRNSKSFGWLTVPLVDMRLTF